jgi:putative ABC transport system permease protein
LASFVAERRTKEVGVRKVLGASVPELVFKFAGDFVKWVLVANLVAWPVAYLAVTKWLQAFAYRTEIGLWPFVAAGFLALIIALATVSSRAIRAARANPVDALRYE